MTIRFTQVAAVGAALFAQAACSSTSGRSDPPPRRPEPRQLDVDRLRAAGPEGLARALAAYDAATGAERERLADVVDHVAAQRYATTSRLYWYTDLDAAEAAARDEHKPILSLRMLGRLDEDQSCANSRFFRVALYANAELSAWLRDHFVLHWSSERPVPKVTIDLGDGRRIDTTVAGNSAHYVLDADGQVIDVIPGLMTAKAFQHELEGALAVKNVERYHAERLAAIVDEWQAIGSVALPRRGGSSVGEAEEMTVTKMRVERPLVQRIALGADPQLLAPESPAWQPIGSAILARRGLPQAALDEQSRRLIAALAPTDWSAAGAPLRGAALDALIASFESAIVADTGLNLTRMREQIHARLAQGGRRDFATINAWLYESVFLTPAQDTWLGMATPGTFTGLPRDGVSRLRRTR